MRTMCFTEIRCVMACHGIHGNASHITGPVWGETITHRWNTPQSVMWRCRFFVFSLNMLWTLVGHHCSELLNWDSRFTMRLKWMSYIFLHENAFEYVDDVAQNMVTNEAQVHIWKIKENGILISWGILCMQIELWSGVRETSINGRDR